MNTTATVAFFAVALVGAWYWDRRSWRRKPREALIAMLQSRDWRYHTPAIKELRRRREDVSPYIRGIVAMLVSDSTIERAAAQLTIKDCFPELAADLKGYSPTAGVADCRVKATPLLQKFGL